MSASRGSVVLVSRADHGLHAHAPLRRRALERLGWTVEDVDVVRPAGFLGRLLGGSNVRDRLLRALDAARPELVLVAGHVELDPALVEEARAQGGARWAAWFAHGLEEAAPLAELAAGFDLVKSSGSDVAAWLGDRLGREVGWLPPAADPSVHRPLRAGSQYRANVVFAGRATARREALLAQLVEFGLAVWGPGWRRTSLRDYCRGERLVTDDFLRAYGGATVAVNLHHAADGEQAGLDTGCNRRVFELAAIGAAQVTDDRADLHRCFTVGEEVLTHRTAAELREQVGALLLDPARAEAIGQAARARALREHTYMHRLRDLSLEARGSAPGTPTP